MSAASLRLSALSVALAVSGCASTSAPDGWLPSPSEAAQAAGGGWVEVRTTERTGGRRVDRTVEGELLAVGPDSLYVLPLDGTLMALATDRVGSARLAYASNASTLTGTWGLLGTLSTGSHGFFLVASAPVWLLTTGLTTASESRAHKLRVSGGRWRALAPYARFPQGLPPGLDRRALRPLVR